MTQTIQNYSTAILLVNPAVKVVKTSYEAALDPATGKKVGKPPFTPWKTMDTTLKVGDLVVIPTGTRWDRTVVRVEEVDVELDIDYGGEVGWLVGRIDDSDYEALLKMEQVGISAIKSAEKRARQEELKKKIMEDNPELARLSAIGAPAPLPAPEPAYEPVTPPTKSAGELDDDIQF